MASFMRPIPTFAAPLSVPPVPRVPPTDNDDGSNVYAPVSHHVPLPPSSDTITVSTQDMGAVLDHLATIQAKLDQIRDGMTAGAQAKRNTKVKEIGDASGPKAPRPPAIHLWLRGVISTDKVVFAAFLNGGNKLCPQGGFRALAEAATCGSKGAVKKIIPENATEAEYMKQFGAYIYSVWGKTFPEEHQKIIKDFRSIYDDATKGPAAAYAAFNLA